MKQNEWFSQPASEAHQEAAAHRARCRDLPPLRHGEAERLVVEFLAGSSGDAMPGRLSAPGALSRGAKPLSRRALR